MVATSWWKVNENYTEIDTTPWLDGNGKEYCFNKYGYETKFINTPCHGRRRYPCNLWRECEWCYLQKFEAKFYVLNKQTKDLGLGTAVTIMFPGKTWWNREKIEIRFRRWLLKQDCSAIIFQKAERGRHHNRRIMHFHFTIWTTVDQCDIYKWWKRNCSFAFGSEEVFPPTVVQVESVVTENWLKYMCKFAHKQTGESIIPTKQEIRSPIWISCPGYVGK